MRLTLLYLLVGFSYWLPVKTLAQDTFSIVAVDPATGEVGSAGASCVDLSLFPGFPADFLADLIPGEGAINTQAFWNEANQNNALQRFLNGDQPEEIIDWLVANDVQGQPEQRQYLVVRLAEDTVYGAAHTGAANTAEAGHVVGENLVAAGNIMTTADIPDSMAVAFESAPGGLSCRLLAALQAAKRLGGDSRCTDDGVSALFAFVKTTLPNAPFGEPAFVLSVQTAAGDGIDPVDSLQTLHDALVTCNAVNALPRPDAAGFSLHPNPTADFLTVDGEAPWESAEVIDERGRVLVAHAARRGRTLDLRGLPAGLYALRLRGATGAWTTRRVVVRR